jgi:dUTP pyrophosphatase
MNIINFGGWAPKRAHRDDAGADCYALEDVIVEPHQTVCVPLNIGIELPKRMVGFILPRSSMASRGLVAQSVPIDSGYRGVIHAIITNYGGEAQKIEAGDRICQLVVLRCWTGKFKMIEPRKSKRTKRGYGAFGSTGK